MRNPLRVLFLAYARLLVWTGLLEPEHTERIVDLAWPKMLAKGARRSRRTADLAMVGLAVGPAGIAAVGFTSVYYGIASFPSNGLSGGVLGQASMRFGAEDRAGFARVVRLGFLLTLLFTLPFTSVYIVYAEELLGLLGASDQTLEVGVIYFQIISVSVLVKASNAVSGRALAAAEDTRIPMLLRGTGAIVNIVVNAVLIFWFGMGITGAAIGTLLSEVLVMVGFWWGFLGGTIPLVGTFPVRVGLKGWFVDGALLRQLLAISTPLMARKLAEKGQRAPLYLILSGFGQTVVAAYTVARRIRSQMNLPAPGFSTAASSLVGQALGGGQETEASLFGREVLVLAVAVSSLVAGMMVLFPRPLAQVFSTNAGLLAQSDPFVQVAGISLVGKGIDRTSTGVLKAAGDTKWPMYGQYLGIYGFMIPIAYLGLVTPLGYVGLYGAMLVETWVPAAITTYRYRMGTWREVSRTYRPEVGAT